MVFKILSAICFIIGLVISSAAAQSNVIKADIIRPLRGVYGITYERRLSKFLSGQAGFDFGDYASTSINGQKDYSLTGVALLSEVRYYPFWKRKPNPFGVFTGIAARYVWAKEKYHDPFVGNPNAVYNEGNILNFGIEAGYKFKLKRFCIEVLGGAGTGEVLNFDVYRDAQIPPSYRKVRNDESKQYRLELNVGYIFPKR